MRRSALWCTVENQKNTEPDDGSVFVYVSSYLCGPFLIIANVETNIAVVFVTARDDYLIFSNRIGRCHVLGHHALYVGKGNLGTGRNNKSLLLIDQNGTPEFIGQHGICDDDFIGVTVFCSHFIYCCQHVHTFCIWRFLTLLEMEQIIGQQKNGYDKREGKPCK